MTDSVDLGSFTFESGESIPRLDVAYETYGEFDGDNAVLVCHALTGGPRVASADDGPRDQARGWWDDVVGPGRHVDTSEYFVVCANVPGSCYGTTGPASVNPETGEPYGPEFPPVSVGDWTRVQRALLDELGVDSLHAVLGGSVGGMNVLEWVRRFPGDVERAIPIATGPRLDPQLVALDAVARRAITGDPHYDGGEYYGDDHPDPDHGLAQARRLGHVTYLSKSSMADRFGRAPASQEHGGKPPAGDPTDSTGPPAGDPTRRAGPYREVESYLDYNAGQFVDRFDANSYLYLTAAMDNYDLSRGHGSDAAALEAFDGAALVLSFSGDWHFPPERTGDLTAAFREAGVDTTHHVVDSEYGHDAFLVEPDRVGPVVAAFLADRDPDAATTGGEAPVHVGLFS